MRARACQSCGERVTQPKAAPERIYCSSRCRQAAYRRRRAVVVWPPALEEAEAELLELVAERRVRDWLALEQFALRWGAAA
jgi:hypothetical protein